MYRLGYSTAIQIWVRKYSNSKLFANIFSVVLSCLLSILNDNITLVLVGGRGRGYSISHVLCLVTLLSLMLLLGCGGWGRGEGVLLTQKRQKSKFGFVHVPHICEAFLFIEEETNLT